MPVTEHDVIVVGAGPAGEVCAGRLAGEGLDVVLIERELVGGECSFYACMPSKALLRPGELLAETHRVPGVAEAVTGELDVEAALKRRDEVIHDLSDESQLPWLEQHSVELFRGEGRLDGEKRVLVGDEVLTARKAVEDGEGAWRWGRKRSSADITALYAATLALWAAIAASNTDMDPANNVW